MTKIYFILGVFLGCFSLQAEVSLSKVSMKNTQEWHDHEIAAAGEIEIGSTFTQAELSACATQESIPFTKQLPKKWTEAIFQKSELSDLEECKPGSCAFNFLPYEIQFLSKLPSTGEKKNAFLQFYKDRVQGKTPVDPRRSWMFIRSKDQKFSFCSSKPLHKLLDQRPIKTKDFRLAFANYDSRMRPTLRLLQSAEYASEDGWKCYAEALIFSDHYDGERVDLWGLQTKDGKSTLRLEIRNRMDFLHSWWRRLKKGSLRDRIKSVVAAQLEAAGNCLKERSKGQ
jgi:hypothetical protein